MTPPFSVKEKAQEILSVVCVGSAEEISDIARKQ